MKKLLTTISLTTICLAVCMMVGFAGEAMAQCHDGEFSSADWEIAESLALRQLQYQHKWFWNNPRVETWQQFVYEFRRWAAWANVTPCAREVLIRISTDSYNVFWNMPAIESWKDAELHIRTNVNLIGYAFSLTNS